MGLIRPGSFPAVRTARPGLVVDDDDFIVFETIHPVGPDAHLDAAHRGALPLLLLEHREGRPLHFQTQPVPDDAFEPGLLDFNETGIA